ncbi:MAG: bifunctional methylenetetrahydrofolate dehydrogenase/methenyltetrahydrofolate cyclohydrolase FolD [Chloroflexi bacterium]|nr:bifunctional methylenetetrahydrofolate dehydrogenase/methenyltetrahydrofolate cyclohydrolase FolD [Chloroflexota bacterium]
MTATVIDGAAIAQQVRGEVASQAQATERQHGVRPGLAVVLVGDNPASASYVRSKERACQEVGIATQTFHLPQDTPHQEVMAMVERLNADSSYHGILTQLPFPPQVHEPQVLRSLDPAKDVDGLHPYNVGLLAMGQPRFIPATPYGVQQLLVRTGNDPGGKHVVVCGRSNLVGKPLALLLAQKLAGANATVTICHTGTRDLPEFTRQADILVAAVGRAGVIRADMVKGGAVVIDVGINRVEDRSRRQGYRLVGDVDYEAVKEVAGAITPVPGGVGPMTVAMLLVNTLRAARLALGGDPEPA